MYSLVSWQGWGRVLSDRDVGMTAGYYTASVDWLEADHTYTKHTNTWLKCESAVAS